MVYMLLFPPLLLTPASCSKNSMFVLFKVRVFCQQNYANSIQLDRQFSKTLPIAELGVKEELKTSVIKMNWYKMPSSLPINHQFNLIISIGNMKFFIVFVLFAACIAQCICASFQGQLSEASQGLGENLGPLRIRKSPKSAYAPPAPSYAPAPAPSYSAPPCPKNYLFSCGPQVQPVPCAQGGYQGSYSENIPQYVAPQYVAPPQYAYPQYAVPVITEV